MIDFLVAWGPMILLIAVWLIVMNKGGVLKYKTHVQEMKDLAAAQLVEMKKTNETLARIEETLKSQK